MRRAFLIPFLFAVCCAPRTPTLTPGPACDQACEALAFYGCEEAQPKRIGARERSCSERCQQIESTGYVTIHPGCVVEHAADLGAIRSLCNYRCVQGKQ